MPVPPRKSFAPTPMAPTTAIKQALKQLLFTPTFVRVSRRNRPIFMASLTSPPSESDSTYSTGGPRETSLHSRSGSWRHIRSCFHPGFPLFTYMSRHWTSFCKSPCLISRLTVASPSLHTTSLRADGGETSARISASDASNGSLSKCGTTGNAPSVPKGSPYCSGWCLTRSLRGASSLVTTPLG